MENAGESEYYDYSIENHGGEYTAEESGLGYYEDGEWKYPEEQTIPLQIDEKGRVIDPTKLVQVSDREALLHDQMKLMISE